MSRSRKQPESLVALPAYDRATGDVTVVVETPKGSHNSTGTTPTAAPFA